MCSIKGTIQNLHVQKPQTYIKNLQAELEPSHTVDIRKNRTFFASHNQQVKNAWGICRSLSHWLSCCHTWERNGANLLELCLCETATWVTELRVRGISEVVTHAELHSLRCKMQGIFWLRQSFDQQILHYCVVYVIQNYNHKYFGNKSSDISLISHINWIVIVEWLFVKTLSNQSKYHLRQRGQRVMALKQHNRVRFKMGNLFIGIVPVCSSGI
jgi:hypothetical protein